VNVRLNYVVLIAALIFGPIAVGLTVGPKGDVGSFVGSLAAMTALAVLLPFEWRRDRRAAATFLLAVSTVLLAVGGSAWAIGDGGAVALAGAFVALAFASWFGSVLWREYRFKDLLPSWLDEQLPGAPMFEDDGVQWTFRRSESPDEAPEVQVHLQNNIEAPRTVSLRLKDESGFAMRSGALLLPGTLDVQLPPRAHAIVSLPFRWHPRHTAKKVQLYCFVNASGPPAPRNRRRLGPPGPRPTPTWLVVLGPLAGHFTLNRGGVHVAVERPARPEPPTGPLLGRVELLEQPALVLRAPSLGRTSAVG